MATTHPNNPKATVTPVEDKENEVKVTVEDDSGHVIVTTTTEGSGPKPVTGQEVEIHYTGWVKDDTSPTGRADKPFDSSVDRRKTFKTPIGVGRVINGWDQGVTLMNVGTKATLEISPEWGYGSRGFSDLIPPNSTLIFEVELLGIK